jgi:hypothetical protein
MSKVPLCEVETWEVPACKDNLDKRVVPER